MNKNIILQRIVENYCNDIPGEWFLSNVKQFGINWKLFDYQIKALENITKSLYLYYCDFKNENDTKNKHLNNKKLYNNLNNLYNYNTLYNNRFFEYYKKEGLSSDTENELSINKKDENFKILSEYYQVENGKIHFKNFINRAAFWMATGSGKTLVMVKLIELLHHLMKNKLIPDRDILILAPKDNILNQIEYHIDIFNKNSVFKIELENIKEWEKIKSSVSLFNENRITVFYYRADNITDKSQISKKSNGERIDFESIYNNGKWYLILDEAHKGEKSTSKRQQYYSILSKNGFIFNFSATFTDDIDIITTVFDFKLDTFLKEGYGKKIYITNSEFKNFRPIKENKKIINDFNDDEKKDIIAQTLILLSLIRKHYREIKRIKSELYHSPLLITLANSVLVEDADLKIFYELLSEIANGNFNFDESKKKLSENFENNLNYLFNLDEIDNNILDEIKNLTKEDFFKNVFNTNRKGKIEVIKIKGNNRELAFKLRNANVPFMLIVASDIISWEDNILEDYEIGETVEEKFFENLDNRDSISILLGSRIFVEGWDSNRPNIINFINIGVNEEAKKFVLQSIGRGIRIEPIKNKRKRFKYIDKSNLKPEETNKIIKYNKLLETLFIFATNKEVIKNILEELEKQTSKWIKIKNIKKNANINEKELPLLVPEFQYYGLNDNKFKINKNDFNKLRHFISKIDDKVLILKENLKVRTLKKLKSENNFDIEGEEKNYKSEILLKNIDNFFNKHVKRLKELKILENHIIHYQEIRTDLQEVKKLEEEIKSFLIDEDQLIKKLKNKFVNKEITLDEYTDRIREISQNKNFEILKIKIDYKIFKEHYYVPILLKENSKHFKHIIKVPGEIEFLNKLSTYLKDSDNELKNYTWWYFSKIDESLDKIKIPYFDSIKGDYSNFCPDFIFWLKKDNNYYIKFIDPKGTEHTTNPIDKIKGFEEFKNKLNDKSKLVRNNLKNLKNIFIKVDLYYFNENIPHNIIDNYKNYWTSDFNKIFKL